MNKKILLIGQRGSGKSTIFQVLSDINILDAGNTVDISNSIINLRGESYTLIDLPGTHSLNPITPAENVTVNYILEEEYDLIINVVDASMLSRGLELSVELTELGRPMIIAVNMQDEARKRGVDNNHAKLSELFGVPVIPTTAKMGKGMRKLTETAAEILQNTAEPEMTSFEFSHQLENEITQLSKTISKYTEKSNISSRYFAIKALENPQMVPYDIIMPVDKERKGAEKRLKEILKRDCFETLSYERHHLSMKMTEMVSQITKRENTRTIGEVIDSAVLHPVWGYILLAGFFLLYFVLIFVVGNFLTGVVDQPISAIADSFASLKQDHEFWWYTINGAYMGFSGVFGIVLPFFLPLVFLTALFEDTGYTARIAFLLDGLMHKIGLHGKSVVPFVLGFGCSIPAIYATRIMENERDRIVTGILIPFIPCSARIAVIFALTAAFTGPIWAVVVFLYVILIIAITGKLMSKVISKPLGLVLEIPALQLPSMKTTFYKTWAKIKDFIKDATLFLISGSILLGWIEYFNVSHYINIVFEPILTYILDLPQELGSTLLFGFFRKELIIVMMTQALGVGSMSEIALSYSQIVVFIIFVTLYFPCFTTFIVMWKEFGKRTIMISAILSITLATVSAFLFKVVMNI